MEEDVRVPLNSKAMTIFTVDCMEDSRVSGEPKVWNEEVEKQADGGDYSSLALWHIESEGVAERQRGPQGGWSQGLDYVVEMEAMEDQ